MTKKSKIHIGMRKTGIFILILILIGGCAFTNTGHEGLGEKSQPDPEMTPTPIREFGSQGRTPGHDGGGNQPHGIEASRGWDLLWLG